MRAFCTYLYQARGIQNFFILAPNLTIYNKLTRDFTPGTPKYVFQGIADFVATPPLMETGDTYRQRGGLFHDGGRRDQHLQHLEDQRRHARPRRGDTQLQEDDRVPGSALLRLSPVRSKEDLAILMDESLRDRGDAGVRAIVLGLEPAFCSKSIWIVPYR